MCIVGPDIFIKSYVQNELSCLSLVGTHWGGMLKNRSRLESEILVGANDSDWVSKVEWGTE